MNIISNYLRKIYLILFFLSLIVFLLQTYYAPVRVRFVLGPMLFCLSPAIIKPICNYLIEKYNISIEDHKLSNVIFLYFFGNFITGFIFMVLYMMFVPLKNG